MCCGERAAAAVARAEERLRFTRRERFAAERGLLIVAIVIAVVGNIAARFAPLLIVGLALAKLLLRGGDQAEIVLGVLIVVFGCDRVAGTLRVTGKLEIFLGDVGRRSREFSRPVHWTRTCATIGFW